MKNTLSLSNFNIDNTSKLLKTIGNYCLLIGGLGSTVALLPFPKVVVFLSALVGALGVIGKILTKLSGQVDDNGNPIVIVPTNAVTVNPKID